MFLYVIVFLGLCLACQASPDQVTQLGQTQGYSEVTVNPVESIDSQNLSDYNNSVANQSNSQPSQNNDESGQAQNSQNESTGKDDFDQTNDGLCPDCQVSPDVTESYSETTVGYDLDTDSLNDESLDNWNKSQNDNGSGQAQNNENGSTEYDDFTQMNDSCPGCHDNPSQTQSYSETTVGFGLSTDSLNHTSLANQSNSQPSQNNDRSGQAEASENESMGDDFNHGSLESTSTPNQTQSSSTESSGYYDHKSELIKYIEDEIHKGRCPEELIRQYFAGGKHVPLYDPFHDGGQTLCYLEVRSLYSKLTAKSKKPMTLVPPQLSWHVGIYKKDYSPYMQICGGTIVTMKAVISAAHCFWSDTAGALPAKRFAVGAGKRYRPWNDAHDTYSQKSDVSAIHLPVRYRDAKTSYQEDIAVLLLAQELTPSPAVKPACVNFDEDFDDEQLKEGNMGTVLGWGLTEEDGEPSQILNYGELPSVGIEKCLNNVTDDFLRYITCDKICAGVSGKAACRGDSGGGLLFLEPAGDARAPFLRGVVSAAPRSNHLCNTHALALFTHVRVHRTFLLRHIPDLEGECVKHFPQVKIPSRA